MKKKFVSVKGRAVFSEENTLEIIEKTLATPKNKSKKNAINIDPIILAKDLNIAYKNYLGWMEDWDAIPTQKILQKRLKDAISKTEKTILSYDRLLPDLQNLSSIYSSRTLLNSEEIIDTSLEDLDLIYNYLSTILESISTNDHIALKRGGKEAKTDLMGRLLPEVYLKHFKRNPARSTSLDGKPEGPMVRFIKACMDHLKIKVTEEAISSSQPRTHKKTSS